MVCPLYMPVADVTPVRATNGNAGLWYDKFCDKWKAPDRTRGTDWSLQAVGNDTNPKLKWMKTLTGQAHGAAAQLEETSTRLIRLSLQQGGLSLVFHAESRFVTGLGRSHPVENGFAWHPTLGTPYLPGSSIKGMVRAWAEQQADPKPDKATLDRLFGASGRVGAVCFLDAVPIDPVRVEADVLTPHYAPWSPDDPPGDWKAPKPIPFLVTAAGLQLLFTVLPNGRQAKDDLKQDDLKHVETWLTKALTWAGAGAKSAVGYGRMGLDQPKTDDLWQGEQQRQQRKQEALREQERLASLDPLELELEQLAAAEPVTSPPSPPYGAWIKAVESGRWRDQPAEALQVLDRIETEMRLVGDWKETSQKKNQNKPDRRFKLTNLVKELRASAQSG
jgi:CRISPR-associated protein Cmr6